MNEEDLPDAADSLSEASGHSSREHQPNDLLNETKQEGVREHPDLEQEHIENLNDLVPDVTPPDICNYDFNEVPSLGSIKVHHAGTNIITLGWAPTEQQVESHYHVLYSCKKIKPQTIQITDSCKVDIEDLLPGTEYTFTIIRIVDGKHSKSESVSVCTVAIPPGNVQVSNVSSSTVSLTWETPAGEVGGYVVTCFYDSETHREQTTDSDTVTFSDLKAGLKYDFQIKTQLKSGGLSQPALTSAHTETKQEGVREHPDLEQEHMENLNDLVPDVTPPDICNYDFNDAIPPGNVQVSHVSSSTVSLTWEPPAGEVGGYVVTCFYDSETHGEQTTDSDTVTFSDLKPGLKYDFQIKTQLKSGGLSQPALTSAHTEAIPPGNVKVSDVSITTVSLTWETPDGEVGGYVVTCFCDSETHGEQTTDSESVTFHDLKPGLKYDFQIKTQLKSGGLSQPALISAHTEAIPPGNVQVSHVSCSTVSLTWETPAGVLEDYVVTCFCDSETHREQTTESDSMTFSDLKPGLKYDFQIKTQLKSGGLSQPALISAHTGELFL
ncbi:unnamed protein product [Gadus morhua 'NCC']